MSTDGLTFPPGTVIVVPEGGAIREIDMTGCSVYLPNDTSPEVVAVRAKAAADWSEWSLPKDG